MVLVLLDGAKEGDRAWTCGGAGARWNAVRGGRTERAGQERRGASGRVLLPSISAKPWFVVATKADLPDTQENFASLQAYLSSVQAGGESHPSGKQNAWKRRLYAVPVSAMRREGVEGIKGIVLDLLGG